MSTPGPANILFCLPCLLTEVRVEWEQPGPRLGIKLLFLVISAPHVKAPHEKPKGQWCSHIVGHVLR